MMLALGGSIAMLPDGAVQAQDVVGARELLPGAQLAGQGRLNWWGLAVYDARLWVKPGFRAVDFSRHPLLLELHYLRSLRGEAIAQRSIEEMHRAGRFTAAQGEQWQRALAALLPDVQAGDRLAGINIPELGIRFLHNGKPIGEIADPRFAALFFAIWLGPATSQPDLRAALLGPGQ